MEDECRKQLFVNNLLTWGERNRKEYPWRPKRDPYSILVAEMMLQRTKASQVVPVYKKFLNKFPDVKSLASATTREILDVIAPLGLEYRAKRLKNIAQEIVSKYSGLIPNDAKSLLNLYGIGNYAAHAILCFAYNEDVPIVDANIVRIVKRVFSLDFGKDVHKKPVLWKFMGSLVPSGRAKEFNWTLIDFGDAVCTVYNPKCKTCPLNTICGYYSKIYSKIKTSD